MNLRERLREYAIRVYDALHPGERQQRQERMDRMGSMLNPAVDTLIESDALFMEFYERARHAGDEPLMEYYSSILSGRLSRRRELAENSLLHDTAREALRKHNARLEELLSLPPVQQRLPLE